MKAIIKQKLVRRARSGRIVIPKKIIGTKDNIIEKVHDYITQRLRQDNLIKVEYFDIEIQTQQGKKTDSWRYTPTYRNEY